MTFLTKSGAVLLNPRHAKALRPMPVVKILPPGKLFFAEIVSFAGFLESQQTTANGSDDFSFATCDPSPDGWIGKIFKRDLTSVWSRNRIDHMGLLHHLEALLFVAWFYDATFIRTEFLRPSSCGLMELIKT